MSKINLKRSRTMIFLLVIAVSLFIVVPALAAAPGEGTVVEGQSVPGIALGFTRAEVESAYGPPASCQSISQGDFAFCSFPVEGGGKVWVRYQGADGGNAGNAPDDVAYYIYWEELVDGWTTTAGVNTALALSNPAAVISAYPNAVVTYNNFGAILQVRDYDLGVQVNWVYDFYTGQTTVNMAISAPSEPPPPREMRTIVTGIDLSTSKYRGDRNVNAQVSVKDDLTFAAAGAQVFATWLLPDGSSQDVFGTTSSAGVVTFQVERSIRGVYSIVINDVVLADHAFDAEASILKASIKVR